MVAAILFTPLGRNIMFAASLAFVATLDPNVLVAVCVKPVIARHDDMA
jgi:hypothetical protein